MNVVTQYCVRLGWALAALTGTSLQANFDGNYSVTPPAPGIYQGFPFHWVYTYGNWTASGGGMTINTLGAPLRLALSVPTISAVGFELRFETHASANGTVSFDSSAISSGPGFVMWFQNAGASIALDTGPAGQPRHFAFAVQTGEVFGFTLSSGGDVAYPGNPITHLLVLENFSAPVPEPSPWVLLSGGLGLLTVCRAFGGCFRARSW